MNKITNKESEQKETRVFCEAFERIVRQGIKKRNQKDLEEKKKIKEKDNERLNQYFEWETKENEKCKKRFFKEFKVSIARQKKIEEKIGVKGSNFYLNFYSDNIFSGGKTTQKGREEIIANLLSEDIQKDSSWWARKFFSDSDKQEGTYEQKDIKQEIDTALWKKIGKYKPGKGASIRTFYNTIAKNTAKDFSGKASKEKERVSSLSPDFDIPSSQNLSEEIAERIDKKENKKEQKGGNALVELCYKDIRAAEIIYKNVVLEKENRIPITKIAKELGITPENARKIKERGLKRIREKLEMEQI